jgi:hypothetical protein
VSLKWDPSPLILGLVGTLLCILGAPGAHFTAFGRNERLTRASRGLEEPEAVRPNPSSSDPLVGPPALSFGWVTALWALMAVLGVHGEFR